MDVEKILYIHSDALISHCNKLPTFKNRVSTKIYFTFFKYYINYILVLIGILGQYSARSDKLIQLDE